MIGKEAFSLRKLNVCVLFGGISPEHDVSIRSAESVLNNMDKAKYNIYPVGITKEGKWIYFSGKDYSMLPADTWQTQPGNYSAAISPVRGQGLLLFCNGVIEEIGTPEEVFHNPKSEKTRAFLHGAQESF